MEIISLLLPYSSKYLNQKILRYLLNVFYESSKVCIPLGNPSYIYKVTSGLQFLLVITRILFLMESSLY